MSDCQHLTATATFYDQALIVCEFTRGQLTGVSVDPEAERIERIDIDCRDCGTSMTYECVAEASAHIQAAHAKKAESLYLNKRLLQQNPGSAAASQFSSNPPPYLAPVMSLFSSRVLLPLLSAAVQPGDGASYPSLEVIDQIVAAYESDERVEWSMRAEYRPVHDRIRSDLLPAWRKAKGNFFTTLGWVRKELKGGQDYGTQIASSGVKNPSHPRKTVGVAFASQ